MITLSCLSRMVLLVQELVEGFDQETAAVVLARYISLKMEMEVSTTYLSAIEVSVLRSLAKILDLL